MFGSYAEKYISTSPEKTKSLGTSFSSKDAELKPTVVEQLALPVKLSSAKIGEIDLGVSLRWSSSVSFSMSNVKIVLEILPSHDWGTGGSDADENKTSN